MQGEEWRDAPAQVDRAEELRQEWGVEIGQVWELPAGAGEERIGWGVGTTGIASWWNGCWRGAADVDGD